MKQTFFASSKMFVVLLALGMSGGCYKSAAQPELNTLLAAITSAYNYTFAKDNIITQNIALPEVTAWQDTVAVVGDFVEEHGSHLINEFQLIQQAGKDLLSTLNINYWFNIAPWIKDDKDKRAGVALNPRWLREPTTFSYELQQAQEKAHWQQINTKEVNDALCFLLRSYLDTIEAVISRLEHIITTSGATKVSKEHQVQAAYALKYLAHAVRGALQSALAADLAALKLFVHRFVHKRTSENSQQ